MDAVRALPGTHRIALLDDDIRFIRMVERILTGERIELLAITTLDLDEAVGIVAAGGFSLALVDIMMYDQASGFDVIERLRAEPRTADLSLIVASGAHREIGRRVDFLRQHDVGVLLKPFHPDELLERIRLGNTRALEAAQAPLATDVYPTNVTPFPRRGLRAH